MPSSIHGLDTSAGAVALPARRVPRARPWWVDVWVRMVGKPLGMIGGLIVLAMLAAALLADWIAPCRGRAGSTGSAPTSSAATS